VSLASERVEVPADPRAQYELSLREQWGDGVPQLPATDDAIQALLDASPYPADHVVCVLPPRNGVATVELDREESIPDLVEALVANGVRLRRVEPQNPTREQLYLAIRTGQTSNQP